MPDTTDYTRKPGNVAWDINRLLEHLNEIIDQATTQGAGAEPAFDDMGNPIRQSNDFGELAYARIAGIVSDWQRQGGIKPAKAMRFLRDLKNAQETGSRGSLIKGDPANAMKHVIYSFLISAMDRNLRVYYPGQFSGGNVGLEAAEIQTTANLMTEDCSGYKIDMTAQMMDVIRFVNRNGFAICLAEDLAGLTGFDEPAPAEPFIDASMQNPDGEGAPGGGETPIPDQEGEWSDMPGGNPAVSDLLDWAETNGCPPELCDRVRVELDEEPEESTSLEPAQPEQPAMAGLSEPSNGALPGVEAG